MSQFSAAVLFHLTVLLMFPFALTSPLATAKDPLAMVRNDDDLKTLARQLAVQPFTQRDELPALLAEMPYEDYQKIAFHPKRAIWWGQGSTCFETFHRGFVQRDQVRIFTVSDAATTEVPFRKTDFQYGNYPQADLIPEDSGHAGLKLIGSGDGMASGEELLTFLGASYFRGRSGNTHYGASARGLAIDVGTNKEEEFPLFRAFWVIRPTESERDVTILALLDSPSVTGAYQFHFSPGMYESQLDVQATLYFRNVPEKVAIAPLTSMWMWGDGLAGPPKDARPAVHDSDGLLIRRSSENSPATSEWIWRALARQSYPSVSRTRVEGLLGFGLLQRNRSFYHFDDHNARYDLRPSVWITPKTAWTNGSIELLELPGAHEGIDNIGAYWVPDAMPSIDTPLELDYSVKFFAGDHAEQSFVGRATDFSLERDAATKTATLSVRFAGPAVKQLCSESAVSVHTQMIRGEVVEKSAERTETGDWIAKLVLRFSEPAPAELSVTLMDADRVLTEQFTYLCPHETPDFVFPAVYTRQE